MSTYIQNAKAALKKRKKQQDYRGLDLKRNYSSFWMDDDKYSRFSGFSSHMGSSSSDLVKLVKLANYRKAITNFVKIVTKQEVPVYWSGSTSYTNGKSINLTTDIQEKNFDVVVGLALHEASHIILSDFRLLRLLGEGRLQPVETFINKVSSRTAEHWELRDFIKNLLNWIEDRRIDHFIFSTSPGYKAYYHKMYDHYWNDKLIHKALLSRKYTNPTDTEHWLFQIINSLNPIFDPKAMPGLQSVIDIINVRNISRLKSTEEALEVAIAAAEVIFLYVKKDPSVQQQQQPANSNQEGQDDQGEHSPQNGSQGQSSNSSEGKENDTDDDSGTDDQEVNEAPELTSSEMMQISKAIAKQKEFLSGETTKKKSTKALQKKLENLAQSETTLQTVGEYANKSYTSVIQDLTAEEGKIANLAALGDELIKLASEEFSKLTPEQKIRRNEVRELINVACEDYTGLRPGRSGNAKSVQEGLEIGSLLGRKLRMHNESRDRVDNRLRTGKIDARRISHAGYDIESIFKQVQVDKYKKAVMHISIDASGSMNGNKWDQTIKTVAAIGKALSTTQNIRLQVSFRYTTGTGENSVVPFVYLAYDSQKNSFAHLVRILSIAEPTGSTPEGLCFEGMIKQHLLIPGSNELDSYFLNFSDGDPAMDGYCGFQAVNHTKTWVGKLRSQLRMQVISYFIDTRRVANFHETSNGGRFVTMYGKDAVNIDCNSMLAIAKSLNNKFLTAKTSSTI
jgi:hypothetical protein